MVLEVEKYKSIVPASGRKSLYKASNMAEASHSKTEQGASLSLFFSLKLLMPSWGGASHPYDLI
jgi:hypothetical protein